MEQIIKRDGIYYYGVRECKSVDDAYRCFRNDYHDSIGRKAFSRLDRLGQRIERIHGFGFCFKDEDRRALEREFRDFPKSRCVLLGLVGISYCWICGEGDVPELGEHRFEDWFDWAFMSGSGGMSYTGKRDKVGRTSKRIRRRYK